MPGANTELKRIIIILKNLNKIMTMYIVVRITFSIRRHLQEKDVSIERGILMTIELVGRELLK